MERFPSKIIIYITIMILLFSSFGYRQAVADNPLTSNRNYLKDFDKVAIEDFIDKFMKENMEKWNVPGVTVSVVKGDKILLKKGYGYADIENKIPVNPDETIFRIASITKLFTSAAVMQLYEKGLIDLNTDVNEYLKSFKIKESYSEPITMHNLLTHTCGFDDKWIGVESLGYKSVSSLEEFLIEHMPSRVRKPGIVTQYSNYGMALAGYIVQEVAGIPYDRYIDDKIFKPLEMKYSSVKINEKIESKLAGEYAYKNGEYKKIREYSVDAQPAGSIYSTANDMANFMIAFLNQGKYKDSQILDKDTVDDMQTQHFTNNSNVPGICYGFIENIKNNHRFIGHGGALNGFRSEVLLDTENKIGLFVAANSSSGSGVSIMLIEEFIDNFYPMEVQGSSEYQFSNKDINSLKKFEGYYRSNRYARNSICKVQLLILPDVKVQAKSNGRLLVTGIGPAEEYVQTKPLVFTNPNNGRNIAFKENAKHNIVTMYPFLGEWTCDKVRWYESSVLHLLILMICLSVFLSAVISLLIIPIIKLIRNKSKQETSMMKYSRFLAGVVSLLNIVFIVCLLVHINSLATISDFGWGSNIDLKILLTVPIISSILTLILIVLNVILVKKKSWTKMKRLYLSIVTIASIVFIIFLNYYNLLGYRY